MPEQEFGFGCVLEPSSHKSFDNLGAVVDTTDVPLPEQFIVPAFRELFDADFRPIKSKMEAFIKNQRRIPCCVGCAASYVKEGQEGEAMSYRDIYRQCKLVDGFGDVLSWGTTIDAAMRVLVMGASSEKVTPSDSTLPLDKFVSTADVTAQTVESRKAHVGSSYFEVLRTDFQKAMFKTKTGIVTSLLWHDGDNMIGADGIMGRATGNPVGGHCMAVIGWVNLNVGGTVKKVYVFLQSFSANFGCCGINYVPFDIINRFTAGQVPIDLPKSLAQLLLKWDGCNVKAEGDPNIYKIQYGVKRKYPDELTFWSFGNVFVGGAADLMVWPIPAADLSVIPKGIDMDIKDAPFQTRELVREIMQHFGR